MDKPTQENHDQVQSFLNSILEEKGLKVLSPNYPEPPQYFEDGMWLVYTKEILDHKLWRLRLLMPHIWPIATIKANMRNIVIFPSSLRYFVSLGIFKNLDDAISYFRQVAEKIEKEFETSTEVLPDLDD